MRIKSYIIISFLLFIQCIFTTNVFGAETITLSNEPNNAVMRGETVKYQLKQEALVDPTLPLYIRITFSEGLTVQNDSIQYSTTADGDYAEQKKFNNKQIIYGSDGFTILLEPPVLTTTITFIAEVESIASDTVSCIASFLSSNENIQVTQKIHELKFLDIPVDTVITPVSGKITASALQKNEVRQINTRRVFYYFFLFIGGLLIIVTVLGIYNHLKSQPEDTQETDFNNDKQDS